MAQAGELDEAEALLRSSESPLEAWDMACMRQAEILGELNRHGDTDAAEAFTHAINDRGAPSQGTDRGSPRAGQARRSGTGRSPRPPDRRPLGTRRRSGRGRPGAGSVRRSRPGRGPSPTRSPTARHEPEHWPHSGAVRVFPHPQACCTGRGSRRLGDRPADSGAGRARFSGGCRRSVDELIDGRGTTPCRIARPFVLPATGSPRAQVLRWEQWVANHAVPCLSPLIVRLTS